VLTDPTWNQNQRIPDLRSRVNQAFLASTNYFGQQWGEACLAHHSRPALAATPRQPVALFPVRGGGRYECDETESQCGESGWRGDPVQ
jgi:hypothetical protein